MRLHSFHKIGANKDAPRLWIESSRLARLGFGPGTGIAVARSGGMGISIRPAGPGVAANRVSSRRAPGGATRPIIDINSRASLSGLAGFGHARVRGSFGRLDVAPSARAFAIARARAADPPFRALELFAGGGTLSDAVAASPAFRVAAGCEINPDFADVWEARHPEADLVVGDIRAVAPAELPRFDVLVAGIPCTSHSPLGRAKKGLAGRPEEGDTGDLFIPVLGIVAARMPLACVFENVPSFGTSAAGGLIRSTLRNLGYDTRETVLRPHEQWGEPQDRRRWAMVATLLPGFEIRPPMRAFEGRVGDFLDAPDPARDAAEAARIARTIEGLRRHSARHRAMGHGFGFTVVDGTESRCPTVVASYHKTNIGPFVATPAGPRLLRVPEIERLCGSSTDAPGYAQAVRILGQGVQGRVWAEIFRQLGDHLCADRAGAAFPDARAQGASPPSIAEQAELGLA